MIKSNSVYKISALCWLPQGGLLGKTYSIVTATEVGADLIKAEYFLLVQRPTAALHHDTFKINLNSPSELERWDILSALDEAQSQVKREVQNLLEARAPALNREDSAYPQPEFKPSGDCLTGLWMRGLFHSQIREILRGTESPKLKRNLELVVQSPSLI